MKFFHRTMHDYCFRAVPHLAQIVATLFIEYNTITGFVITGENKTFL